MNTFKKGDRPIMVSGIYGCEGALMIHKANIAKLKDSLSGQTDDFLILMRLLLANAKEQNMTVEEFANIISEVLNEKGNPNHYESERD